MPTLRVWIISENYQTRNIGGIYTACFRWVRTFRLFDLYGMLYGLFKDNIHYWQFKGVSTKENCDPVIMKWIFIAKSPVYYLTLTSPNLRPGNG